MSADDVVPDPRLRPVDPAIAGLERKLDVLRAQLAAARAGRDPGEAGPEAWSRLEAQAQEIAALKAALAEERAAALGDVGTAADGYRAKALAVALGRARAELVAGQRTIAQLSAALLEAALHECPPPPPVVPPPPPPPPPPVWDERAMYEAIIRSTSWRLTRPLRVVGRLLKAWGRGAD